MYKEMQELYLNFRKFIYILFETMTCRTKPYYQSCNYDDDDGFYIKHPN